MILQIIWGLLFLSVLVFIHEFGHYYVGKKCGIGVNEFAVGFGPKIFSFMKKDTVYSIRCIPLGGFTAFEGEDDTSDSPTAMNNVAIYKRVLTVLAGPVFNIVAALIMSVCVLFFFGEGTSKITVVTPDSPAFAAGIQEGDVITDVDGRGTVFSLEVISQLYHTSNRADTTVITVDRNGEELSFDVAYSEENTVGVGFGEVERLSFIDSITHSFRWGYAIMYDTFVSLSGLITGVQPLSDVGGAIAVVDLLGTAVTVGFSTVLRVGIIMSFSLGIMNLLPIPALDGGRLVFYVIEAIRKKPINRDIEAKIHLAGFVLLFGIMLLFVYNDIVNIFVR